MFPEDVLNIWEQKYHLEVKTCQWKALMNRNTQMNFSSFLVMFQTLMQQLIRRSYVFISKNRNFLVKNNLCYTFLQNNVFYYCWCNKLLQTL